MRKERICFNSMACPRCNVLMSWNLRQGPLGGWKCPKCGLSIDKK